MTALESAIRVSLGRTEYAPTRQMAATDAEPMNIIYAAHQLLRLLDEERAKNSTAAERVKQATSFRVGGVEIAPTFSGTWRYGKTGPTFEAQTAHLSTAALWDGFADLDAAYAALVKP